MWSRCPSCWTRYLVVVGRVRYAMLGLRYSFLRFLLLTSWPDRHRPQRIRRGGRVPPENVQAQNQVQGRPMYCGSRHLVRRRDGTFHSSCDMSRSLGCAVRKPKLLPPRPLQLPLRQISSTTSLPLPVDPHLLLRARSSLASSSSRPCLLPDPTSLRSRLPSLRNLDSHDRSGPFRRGTAVRLSTRRGLGPDVGSDRSNTRRGDRGRGWPRCLLRPSLR